ncbi:MAG: glycosyltransferase [Acidobacteriia bacterium]|nr:glycosyltransferase [Terriglobia bacterium]
MSSGNLPAAAEVGRRAERDAPAAAPLGVCHIASGDRWAGAEVQIATLLKFLAREERLRLSAILLNRGRLAKAIEGYGIAVKVIPESEHNFLGILRDASGFLSEKSVQILHSHRYKENLLAALLARRSRVPHIVRTQHGLPEPLKGMRALKQACVQTLDRFVARRVTERVISVSSEMTRHLTRYLSSQKIVTIPNRLDLESVHSGFTKDEAKQRLGISGGCPVIGTAGRLEPVKRLDIFLAMAGAVAGECPEARFVIAGEGREELRLKALAGELGLAERALFLGHRDDIYDILRAFDLLVLSSDREGLPMVLLEALSSPSLSAPGRGRNQIGDGSLRSREDCRSGRAAIFLAVRADMKLVWLSHFIPFPPRGGSRQRSFNLIRHISRRYETHLVALNMQGETRERATEYASELRKYCVEVEIWDPPYRWRGARWWAQLALSPFYHHPYGGRALWSPALGRRWEGVLAGNPDALVHFDSIDLALYFPPAAGVRKVLNHHNCESAMSERRAAREPNPLKRVYLRQQARKLRRLEEETCHQFDINLTVSELDTRTLLQRNPQAHCHVVENGTDTEYFHPSGTAPEPNTLIFAGGLSWYPNVSGIQYFARDIWPLLKRQSPGIRWYLAGRSPAAAVIQVAKSGPDITLVPDPQDIRPWIWKAAVFVCPIIDGGGTRLKILDALAMGKAVVSTTIGAEGLDVTPGEHLLVADTPADFAGSVAQALADDNLRQRLAACGRALAERLYSWGMVSQHLEEAYRCALDSPRHRGEAQEPGRAFETE